MYVLLQMIFPAILIYIGADGAVDMRTFVRSEQIKEEGTLPLWIKKIPIIICGIGYTGMFLLGIYLYVHFLISTL